ncbi:MAG: hypothetical protein H9533_21975 [Rhodobacteraceae bacterium]|nr:hypothetical protein [Paracoccaceae bacterium]
MYRMPLSGESASRLRQSPRARRNHPKRTRRGLSLIEAMLVSLLAVIATDQIVEMLNRELVRKASREEYRLLDDAAAAGAAFLERDLLGNLATARDSARQITLSQLTTAGLWSPAKPMVSRRKRDIELWYLSVENDALLVFAVAASAVSPPSLPEADPATDAVGWISPLQPEKISGPGVDYDIPPLLPGSAPQTFVPGAAVALRHLSLERDALPYLYRSAIAGREDLNTMATDLIMGGNDIIGVGNFATSTLVAGTANIDQITASQVEITDQITAETVTSTGEITADSGSFTNSITAATVAAGTLTTSQLTATDADVTTLRATDHIVAGSMSVSGAVTAERIDTPRLETDNLAAGTVAAGQATATNLTVDAAIIQSLNVNSCTGC